MMRPEDDPRFIPPRPTIRQIGQASIPQWEAQVAFHDQMLGMFMSEGWRSLQTMLTERSEELLGRLKHGPIAEVEANRGALSIVDWLLGLEEESKQLAALARERLYELREES